MVGGFLTIGLGQELLEEPVAVAAEDWVLQQLLELEPEAVEVLAGFQPEGQQHSGLEADQVLCPRNGEFDLLDKGMHPLKIVLLWVDKEVPVQLLGYGQLLAQCGQAAVEVDDPGRLQLGCTVFGLQAEIPQGQEFV